MQNTNQAIGSLIADFREQSGITQKELASRIGTSQSAVARIEHGDQNLTLDTISKISTALRKPVMTLSDGSIGLIINGGRRLSGTAEMKTAKNSAMAMLAATLLNTGTTLLKRMPHIEEVARIVEVLESIGVSVRWVGDDMEVKVPKQLRLADINREAAMKTRSILMFAGPLAHRLPSFTLPVAGGCNLGSRTIAPHLAALEALGIKAEGKHDAIHFNNVGNAASEIVLYEMGDTATNNAIFAAAGLPGPTTIKFASSNYMVQDLCVFLQSLGVRIEGIGTSTLVIEGKRDIATDAIGYPSEDPTEAMFFIAAAIVTKSELSINRVPIDFLELELLKLKMMGLRYDRSETFLADNGHTKLADLTLYPSELTALTDKLHSLPYPGINADNLPFFAVIATGARGTTLIHDWMYEKRAIYYTELDKLGAETILADPHRIFITGPTGLKAAEIVCPPALRPATVILIGMLGAEGTSILRNIYSINRGYEDLVNRLNALGASISLLQGIS
jgi:UDP-N-acetylglucosamine 1-carboxyvinyltransferase